MNPQWVYNKAKELPKENTLMNKINRKILNNRNSRETVTFDCFTALFVFMLIKNLAISLSLFYIYSEPFSSADPFVSQFPNK